MITLLCDLVDPKDPHGRTYRQVNAAKAHEIPVGTLVELENGARLFVVMHSRDCDSEPLYCLGPDPDDTEPRYKGFINPGWTGGYGEESLTVVSLAAEEPSDDG